MVWTYNGCALIIDPKTCEVSCSWKDVDAVFLIKNKASASLLLRLILYPYSNCLHLEVGFVLVVRTSELFGYMRLWGIDADAD